MTGRERFLAVTNHQKPDRLPCQVHCWMNYYLQQHLGGRNQYQAYQHMGMDPVIYVGPEYKYSDADKANWIEETTDLGTNAEGRRAWATKITTPEGVLTTRGENIPTTGWTTEYLIKNERDFEIWNKYVPLPTGCDWSPVIEARNKIGDTGITRGWAAGFGQGSPWQDFCCLYDTEPAIFAAMDKPDWLHHVLESILQKRLRIIEAAGRIENDLIECGGGAGSNTVISPAMFREFCLPYDRRQHAAIKAQGGKVVYHLCGGLMKMLEMVADSGADGIETMTPPSMGGDCDLAAANRLVGGRLFFVGGFDQNEGFERGTPAKAAEQVRRLHTCCPDGGYICSPSDHFFKGHPDNIRAFAQACRESTY